MRWLRGPRREAALLQQPFFQGVCGARWNRAIGLSIISARHRYRGERLGKGWYWVVTVGKGT
jgi:hypothetical protein